MGIGIFLVMRSFPLDGSLIGMDSSWVRNKKKQFNLFGSVMDHGMVKDDRG